MSTLFDTPLIEGLAYREDFISPDEETALLDRLGEMDLSPFRFQGWVGNRKTRSYGWRYDFEDASFSPAGPMPDWLLPVRDGAAAFARVEPDEFTHALVARYDPGAGIGWHKDRDVFEKVVGVSLNTPAALRFRQRTAAGFRRASIELEPRSAYLLSGEARWAWEHRITPGDRLRFSVTFRTLSEKGRRKAEAQRIS